MGLVRKKISLVHVAKKKLGLSDDDYRAVLLRAAGVSSSRDLDDWGFNQVMQEFARLGFQSDFGRRNLVARRNPFMASSAQLGYIRRLWSEYTDGEGTDASLGKWLERSFKVSSVRFITADLAPKAITALKAMNAKKAAKAKDLKALG